MMTDKTARDVVVDVLRHMESTDAEFLAARDVAVRMLESIIWNSEGGFVWKGREMRLTREVLSAARRRAGPAAPAGPQAMLALDRVIASLDLMATHRRPVGKGGST